MTLYTYRCVKCSREMLLPWRADRITGDYTLCCGEDLQRVWGFSAIMSMPEHWNSSLGKPISNQREFNDGLKQQSDHMSERLGYDQTYVQVDPTDRDSLGVTDEGIGAKYDLTP